MQICFSVTTRAFPIVLDFIKFVIEASVISKCFSGNLHKVTFENNKYFIRLLFTFPSFKIPKVTVCSASYKNSV